MLTPSCTTSAAMTSSPSSSSMPFTPPAPRPIGRTSSSEKRMIMPSLVAIMTSRWPSVRRAVITRSSSSRPIAWIPPARVRLDLGLLDRPLLGREQDVAAGSEITHRHARRDHLALAQREEVHHRFALGLAPALGDLVHLQPVDLAAVREEEEIRVRGGDEEILDDVLFLGLHARDALAAATLAAVRLDVRTLDVARARDGDHHLLVGQ